MIVIDSSVWIGNLRNQDTAAVRKLRALDPMQSAIVVPDLVLLEVLRGARDEASAARIERNLSKFDIIQLGGKPIAVSAAQHYRRLRGMGITIRSCIDLLIGEPSASNAAQVCCTTTGETSS